MATPTLTLRPLVFLLALATLAGCARLERLPRPGGQTGNPPGGRPGPLPDYAGTPDLRPVVVTGADLGALSGTDPGQVVAFAYEGGQWRQIPVQIDERFVYDPAVAYRGLDTNLRLGAGAVAVPGYADPNTLVGPDPNEGLDADDEVALMLAAFGSEGAGHPAGVVERTGVEVAATAGGATRYAYLYRRADAQLDPAAGADLVRYDPRFRRGPYLQTYDRIGRPPPQNPRLVQEPYVSNPEDTSVRTAFYEIGFSDRWILNQLRIEGGPDILDVDMYRLTPEDCGRTPFTASSGRGAFIVNRDGPVRAIRRVIGFNSGPLSEMEWVFYERLAESTATLRVHRVPGLLGYFDHSPEAVGMQFRAAGTDWVAIDGRPDRLATPEPDWGMVTGRQGSYVVTYDIEASGLRLPPVEVFYYDDQSPDIPTCLLDASLYGANGVWVSGALPNTDPSRPERAGNLVARRRFAFGGDPEEALRALQDEVRVRTRSARGGA